MRRCLFPLLGLLTGCIWGGVYSLGDRVRTEAHSCACEPGGKAGMRPCADDGALFCCNECGARCSARIREAEEQRTKPPIPIPLPCKEHCQNSATCEAGRCCKVCGHACL